MIECKIPCRIPGGQFNDVERSINEFSRAVEGYGFSACISRRYKEQGSDSVITLAVDDEKIAAMKGAKRGPKEKPTLIPFEEMLALKQEGHPPKEIAELAGISIATYFRKMAAYKNGTTPVQKNGGEEK